ncbi:hypothetical protein M378DRAFT_42169, partial [Amanita muscaria Koide BX008]
HRECNTELTDGCTRCGPKQTGTCCDLHNPDAFAYIQSPVIKPSRKQPCSSIPKHVVDETDTGLLRALENWRCNETEKTYGKHYLRNLGPGLVMGTAVRDRIVECARFSKIRTIADLEKETKWDSASEHGAAIIAIITEHYPLP